MNSSNANVNRNNNDKTELLSVRCAQDCFGICANGGASLAKAVFPSFGGGNRRGKIQDCIRWRKSNHIKNICSEKKILLIDGYAASGKSVCTRLSRINENNGDVFCETFCLSEYEFNNKNISHIYNKTGILYGMNLKEIDSFLNLRKTLFLIANDFFRKEVYNLYVRNIPIINVFIQSSEKNRLNRILKADLGDDQKKQRLKRFLSNKTRNMDDFNYVIRNESSMSRFNEEVFRLIDYLY